jgi:hypothetical protein
MFPPALITKQGGCMKIICFHDKNSSFEGCGRTGEWSDDPKKVNCPECLEALKNEAYAGEQAAYEIEHNL